MFWTSSRRRWRPTIAERGNRLVVVTDLDGCLLDARTYALAPARSALARLKRRGVPLILCTSKTRAEVSALYAELGSQPIAIIEDGGGVLFPPGTMRLPLPAARRTAHGRLLPLASPYQTVRRAFADIRRRTASALMGFGDLNSRQIAVLTGLGPEAARRAARREFDEPFVYLRRTGGVQRLVRRLAAQRGMVVTRGGRFDHLHGAIDKGAAVRRVRAALEAVGGPLKLVALGDSPMDLAFMQLAEAPIIVPRPDGRPDPALGRRLPAARLAPAPGPRGWCAAVHAALDEAGLGP